MIRTYTELSRIHDFTERFRYLSLGGTVGISTFGNDRYLNQGFYTSREWRNIRNAVIVRDGGCDLGIEGREIHKDVLIHHMNPIVPDDLIHGNEEVLDPEFLITTTKRTHNAIHFGDESMLLQPWVPRRPGDTRRW